GRRQQQVLGLCGNKSQQCCRRGRDKGRVVVLAGGEDVEADLLCLAGNCDSRLNPLFFGGCPPSGGVGCDVPDTKDPQLHSRYHPSSLRPTSGSFRAPGCSQSCLMAETSSSRVTLSL